jgi:CRP/FNR family cyclic AMP-dependent transcriptional regulator
MGWLTLDATMPCDAQELRHVPLFSLLDDDEIAVLSCQVELRTFAPRQRIYKIGEPGDRAYVLLSGGVKVTTIDEDQQEITVDEPRHGEFFGFASMLEQTTHHTSAMATDEAVCLEVDRHDIAALIEKKPMAGLDMMTVLARQFHASQELIRLRAARNPNEILDEEETFGERIADVVASFGGSWTFIIIFLSSMVGYVILSIILVAMRGSSWDPYPFILLNLFLSMLAAIQAPVIMMSQNRQDKKDRLRSELDFDVNVRAESEIQSLSRRLTELHDKLDDVDELLRQSKG